MTQKRKAQKLCSQLISHNFLKNELYWKQAEILNKLYKDNLFHYMEKGDVWEVFSSNIGIPATTSFKKVANYRFFIEKHGLKIEEVAELDVMSLELIKSKGKNLKTTKIREAMKTVKKTNRASFFSEFMKN